MPRISIPALDQTPAATRPLLDAVKKQLGVVPNLMKVVGNSPAALGGYLALSGALAKGALGAKTGERIALAIAEINACRYCLAAHTYLGQERREAGRRGNRRQPERCFERPQGGCGGALCRERRPGTRTCLRCRRAGREGRRLQ